MEQIIIGAITAPLLAILLLAARGRRRQAEWNRLENQDRKNLDDIPWTGSGCVFRDGDTVRHVPIYRLPRNQQQTKEM